MPITIPLLDSLLSPHPAEAEQHYHSIPLESRVVELTSILVQTSSAANSARSLLAATLLRRDLSTLNNDGVGGQIVEPLMVLFEGGTDAKTKRMVGRCVAELCGGEWIVHVLKRLEGGCTSMSIPHLHLLGDLADCSPLALWSSNLNITSFFVGVTSLRLTLQQLEAALEAIVSVSIAYEKAKRVSTNGAKSDIEKALLMQFSERCIEIDINSPPAELGRVYLPTLLHSLIGYAESSNDTDAITQCMSHLSSASVECPSLLAGGDTILTTLLQICMAVAQLGRNDDEFTFVKLSALDVLSTICSVPPIKKMILQPNGVSPNCVTECRPLLQFLIKGQDGQEQRGVFALCAQHIVNGVDCDETEWAEDPASIYEDEWEGDRTASYAEWLLESFVEILGGVNALPHIFQLVDVLLVSASWQTERAVLCILERCLAAAPVTFAPHVQATVETALRLASSASRRVQFQSLQVLGALCIANYVGEEVSKSQIVVREIYGDRILQCVAALAKSSCSKVASNACLSIVSYCRGGNGSENCLIPIDKELIVPFVEPLLEALQASPLAVNVSNPSSISEGSLTVLNRAIDAIACLADASGEDFMPFYSIVTGLKKCATFGLEQDGGLRIAAQVRNSFEVKKLRGSALEAATIVGAAVSGPDGENIEAYAQDASDIMTTATTLLNSGNVEIVPMDQLLAACARIAAVMGLRYVPFLPSVLPHILKRATEKLDVSVTDEKESNLTSGDDEEGYSISIPGVGSKKVKINTTQLEEKSLAARALYEHARALGKDFDTQSVESSATALLPLVNCIYSGEVRATAALALSQVFRAACLASAEDLTNTKKRNTCQHILNVLPKALVSQLVKENDEEDVENRDAIADALSEVMYDVFNQVGPNGERVVLLSASDAKESVSSIMNLIELCLNRRSTLFSQRETDIIDEDDRARCEEKLSAEAELLTHLVDSVGYQLKSLGVEFVSIFAEYIVGTLGKLLTSSGTSDIRARVASVCLFDDCIEHCGANAANAYAPMLLVGITEGLESEDEDLLWASAYGVLQVVSHAPKSLNPTSTQSLLEKAFPLLDSEEQQELQVALQKAVHL